MSNKAIIKSLINVLSQGESVASREALDKLLARNSDLALVGIIMAYHYLGDELKNSVAEQAARFKDVLPYLVRKGNKQSRFNCIDFVSRADAGEYTSLLVACASDSDRQLADQAVSAIAGAVDAFIKRQDKSADSDASADSLRTTRNVADKVAVTSNEFKELRGLLKALLVAVETLEVHDRGEIVDALVKLGKRGDQVLLMELKQVLGMGRGREALIKQMIEKPRSATVMLLFSMLESGSAMLRRLAERLLTRCAEGEAHALLIDTIKAKGSEETNAIVRQTRSIPWLKQCSTSMDQLGDELLLGWVNEIDEMEVEVSRKIQLLKQCLNSRSEKVIERVFAVICKHYTPLIRPLLIQYSESDCEPLRFHAVHALSRTQFTGKSVLLKQQLENDSNRIRSLAATTLAGDHFTRLVSSFDTLNEESRHALALMVSKADTGMTDKIMAMLGHRDPRTRLRALRILSYTGGTPELELPVMRLVRDPDGKVRAAASRLLSKFASKECARLALALLNDKDIRVRANAIEVVESFGHDAFQRALLPQLKATEARVRANAAKAMVTLGSPLALRILEAMSSSRTSENRLSGVWALANLKQPGTIQRAFDIAKFETNTGLQRRMLRFIDDAEDDIREVKFGSRPMRKVA